MPNAETISEILVDISSALVRGFIKKREEFCKDRGYRCAITFQILERR